MGITVGQYISTHNNIIGNSDLVVAEQEHGQTLYDDGNGTLLAANNRLDSQDFYVQITDDKGTYIDQEFHPGARITRDYSNYPDQSMFMCTGKFASDSRFAIESYQLNSDRNGVVEYETGKYCAAHSQYSFSIFRDNETGETQSYTSTYYKDGINNNVYYEKAEDGSYTLTVRKAGNQKGPDGKHTYDQTQHFYQFNENGDIVHLDVSKYDHLNNLLSMSSYYELPEMDDFEPSPYENEYESFLEFEDEYFDENVAGITPNYYGTADKRGNVRTIAINKPDCHKNWLEKTLDDFFLN